MTWPPSAEELAATVAELVRQEFDHEGSVAPTVIGFATRDPVTGQRLPPALVGFRLYGAPGSFAAQLRCFARDLGVILLVQAYEIRMVGTLDEQHLRGHERLEADPAAKDYVVIFVEDQRASRSRAWLAPVDHRRGVKPFAEVPAPRVEGWLTAILPSIC